MKKKRRKRIPNLLLTKRNKKNFRIEKEENRLFHALNLLVTKKTIEAVHKSNKLPKSGRILRWKNFSWGSENFCSDASMLHIYSVKKKTKKRIFFPCTESRFTKKEEKKTFSMHTLAWNPFWMKKLPDASLNDFFPNCFVVFVPYMRHGWSHVSILWHFPYNANPNVLKVNCGQAGGKPGRAVEKINIKEKFDFHNSDAGAGFLFFFLRHKRNKRETS